jgi:hypothetical protein
MQLDDATLTMQLYNGNSRADTGSSDEAGEKITEDSVTLS